MTEWVSMLAASSEPAVAVRGWTPPKLTPGMQVAVRESVDFDSLRQMAQEEGFRAGYAEGQAAGSLRGYAEGQRAGREEAKEAHLAAESESLGDFRAALSAVVAGVGPAVRAWQTDVEERATTLAMDAVRALLAAELSIERPDAMGIVREALGFAEGAVRATIRLSPFDRAALAERREDLLAACVGLRDVEMVDDRSIEGGCIVETEGGVVDATLATRLSLLEAA